MVNLNLACNVPVSPGAAGDAGTEALPPDFPYRAPVVRSVELSAACLSDFGAGASRT